MFDDDDQQYWDHEYFSNFEEWLGRWLPHWLSEPPHAYQERHENDPPGPLRYLWRTGRRSLAIWICLGPEGEFGAARQIESMKHALACSAELADFELILASPGDVTLYASDIANHPNVRILDATYWLQQWEHVGCWHAGVAALLRRRLHQIPAGRDGADRLYEDFVGDLLHFLFSPNLGRPQRQSVNLSATKRRDCLFAINPQQQGIWTDLAHFRRTLNLVVEAKNLTGPATIGEVEDAALYLDEYAPGNLCVLASRIKPNATAYKRVREFTKQGKLIIPIYDDVVSVMLDWAAGGRRPDDVIAAIASEVTSG